MVVPGTFRPAADELVRAVSPACEPMVSTQPKITSSYSSAGIALRYQRLEYMGAEVDGMHIGQRAFALAGPCAARRTR